MGTVRQYGIRSSLPDLKGVGVADSHSQIRSYVFDVVRAIVPKINLDDVFTVGPHIAPPVLLRSLREC